MTRYLIERGHRRIAMILAEVGPSRQRALGYASVMRAAGLRPDVVTDSRYSEESGARAMSEILARGQERPTAIFGANDMLAVGAIEIVAGALVAWKPYYGGYLVTLWLWGIIGNLLLARSFYDVALRDFGLSLGATALARLSRRRVFSLNYRLAPEHRFPAALDDAIAAYRWLLEQGLPASSIALAGDSAGGPPKSAPNACPYMASIRTRSPPRISRGCTATTSG